MTTTSEMTLERVLVEHREDLDALRGQEGAPWSYHWAEMTRLRRNMADRLCAEVGTIDARRIAKGQRISATYSEKQMLGLLDFIEKDEAEKAQGVSA